MEVRNSAAKRKEDGVDIKAATNKRLGKVIDENLPEPVKILLLPTPMSAPQISESELRLILSMIVFQRPGSKRPLEIIENSARTTPRFIILHIPKLPEVSPELV